MKPTSLMFLLLVLSSLNWTWMPADAIAQPSYTEDFTTKVYEHTTFTSADWNTGLGEIGFPPFAVTADWTYGNTGGNARNVEAAHGYIFVAMGSQGFQVWNPIGWGPDAIHTTPGYCWDVEIQGSRAYVADGLGGFQIFDVSSPISPVHLGGYNTTSYAYGIEVDGNRAYVCDGAGGFKVFMVTNPASPTLMGTFATTGHARNAKIRGHLAFVADAGGYLRILDVSVPGSPTQVGSISVSGSPYGIDIAGNHAYLASTVGGMHVVDISDPAAPFLVGTVSLASSAFDVEVSGNRAFVATNAGGLNVIDITNPTTPTLIQNLDTSGVAYGVCVEDSKVYVADDTGGVTQFAISTYVTPAAVARVDMPGTARDVVVAGDLAFVAAYSGGVRVVDVSVVEAPVEIGSYDIPGSSNGIAVALPYLYVAHGAGGVLILDVSDPTAPTLAGSYTTSTSASDVAIAGSTLYLSDGTAGFKTFDISNPTVPVLADVYATTPQAAGRICLAGDKAYVACNYGGLYIFDVSNLYSLSLLGSYNTSGMSRDVAVIGSHALVADREGGLAIIDVSNPASPSLSSSILLWSNAEGVTIAGDQAYVSTGLSGIQVVDISNPALPQPGPNVLTVGEALRARIEGDHLFAAMSYGGLGVFQHMQSEWDVTGGIGRSLEIDTADDPIVRARLSATTVGNVSWQLSATGAGPWTDIQPDNQWTELAGAGSELVWRSEHSWAYGTNSSASALTIEWLNRFAAIQSVADIPDDQGRQVRVEWLRSGHDFVGDATQIVEYAVYRKIAPGLARSAPLDLEGESLAVREHAAQLAAIWDFVASVPVRVEDFYAVVVPTLADSTIVDGLQLSTFMVSALTATPGVYFDSPEVSGYSVDNLAPGVPSGLLAHYQSDEVSLDWDDAPEADFRAFRIYRDTDPGFDPSPSNLVAESATSNWTDGTASPWNFVYKITAVDFAGNESEVASMEAVTGTPEVRGRTVLHAATPNPFNPSTTIVYSTVSSGHVELTIYDVGGRRVRTLVSEYQTANEYSVMWNGRDDHGKAVASGVYLYRLKTDDFQQSRRMILMK